MGVGSVAGCRAEPSFGSLSGLGKGFCKSRGRSWVARLAWAVSAIQRVERAKPPQMWGRRRAMFPRGAAQPAPFLLQSPPPAPPREVACPCGETGLKEE